jgi:hypothetical protein
MDEPLIGWYDFVWCGQWLDDNEPMRHWLHGRLAGHWGLVAIGEARIPERLVLARIQARRGWTVTFDGYPYQARLRRTWVVAERVPLGAAWPRNDLGWHVILAYDRVMEVVRRSIEAWMAEGFPRW